jgi:hypothetical protein
MDGPIDPDCMTCDGYGEVCDECGMSPEDCDCFNDPDFDENDDDWEDE